MTGVKSVTKVAPRGILGLGDHLALNDRNLWWLSHKLTCVFKFYKTAQKVLGL